MRMKSPVFDSNLRLVESGPEPTIREMIFYYYASHGVERGEAEDLTDRLIDAALLAGN